jgi:hypothetical protein
MNGNSEGIGCKVNNFAPDRSILNFLTYEENFVSFYQCSISDDEAGFQFLF